MTYSDLIARGSGSAEYLVRIEGVGPVLGTALDYPADSWYSAGGHSYLRGIRPATIARMCAGRPGEVWPDLRTFTIEFDDPNGVLAAELKDIDGCITTELTASLTEGATTINVASTSLFPSSGVVHVEREAISYTGKSATSFTGCTRGHHGSEAVEHYYSTDTFPACIPLVSSGPAGLRGRRVEVYAVERTDSGMSAASRVWIGYVKGAERSEAGRIYIPVAHVLDGFVGGQAMGAVPAAQLRGLYVPNTVGNRWGRMILWDADNGIQVFDLVADGDVEYFESGADLVREFLTAFNDVGGPTTWEAGQLPDGRVFVWCNVTLPCDGVIPWVALSEISRLPVLLGYDHDDSMIASSNYHERIVAQRAPASVFAVTNPRADTFEPRLYLGSGQAQFFVESFCRVVDGAGGERILAVTDVNSGGDYLSVSSLSSGFPISFGDDAIIQFGDGLQPAVYQVWGHTDLWIDDLVRLLWAGETYGSSLGYTLPDRWLPEPCLRDGDVDWAGLRVLCSGVPAMAGRVFLNVREPTPVTELVTGNLMALGIYAVVLEDGSVGWRRVELPTAVGVTTAVGAAMIDGARCVDIQTERSRDRLVNIYRFEVANAHLALLTETTGTVVHGVPTGANVIVTDQASLGRYGARSARMTVTTLGEVTDTIKLQAPPTVFAGVGPASDALGRFMAGTLRYLGRPRPHVRLPVTIKGRALEIGDAVLLTTTWVQDTLTGAQGVSSKLCVVVGWERQEGFRSGDVDWLDLVIIDAPAGAIAPAALATNWDTAEEFSFTSTDLFHGDDDASDLSHFEAGDKVEFIQYDDSTPTIGYGTILSVDVAGKTVNLTATPTGTITTPCIMRFQGYSSCVAGQQGEGWIWTAGDDDALVQDARVGWRWE